MTNIKFIKRSLLNCNIQLIFNALQIELKFNLSCDFFSFSIKIRLYQNHHTDYRKLCPRNSHIDQYLIPEATDGSTVSIIEAGAVPGYIAIVVEQVAVPGFGSGSTSSTPEDSVDTNIAETTIAISKTTWESGKAIVVSSWAWRGCSIP